MSQKFAMDYIDVAARIVEFREKYPDGRLRPADLAVPYRIENIGNETFIVVVAAAHRDKDDDLPGIGMAYEVFPGKTPYTRGSELQNAETSAWGRAIVAALAADTKKGVSSAEEVRNRQAERDTPPPAEASQEPSEADKVRAQIGSLCKAKGYDTAKVEAHFAERMQVQPPRASFAQLVEYRDWLQNNELPEAVPA